MELEPGVYRLPDPKDDGAIIVEGDGITLDFSGVTLDGAPQGTADDEFTGRGIVVHGRDVTIKNARVKGYKVAIYAQDSPGITLNGCDVSRNYRQHLKSALDHEDLADWLYGHENDHDEWLRYGAGMYLVNCPRATISNCRARNGQNGLCLVRSDEAHVVDNDMSFLSGWGLAMWRSSHCDVFNNKFDWCIRGYSHGVYSRGQDSAGILVYEQCHDNAFAFNSATHGGDGFFLYAGNETLQKTGAGGCNNNLLYRNDFSHAAANGIEATFSKGNRFIENVLDECEHGVWAGYSSDSVISGNIIRHCRNGVSIEHGSGNRIVDNTIEDNEQGVHLWWDDDEDLLASAFCKANKACPSTYNVVVKNRFSRVKTGVHLMDDTRSCVRDNFFVDAGTPIRLQERADGLQLDLEPALRHCMQNESPSEISFRESLSSAPTEEWATPGQRERLKNRKGRQDAVLPSTALRGRRFIFVDDWGPYDFTGVRLFPSRIAGGSTAKLNLLGPAGSTFQTDKIAGDATVDPQTGSLPARITLQAARDGLAEIDVDFLVGGQRLSARGVLLRSNWRVSFYSWSTDEDPRNGEEYWKKIIAGRPLESVTTTAVDFVWGSRGPAGKVPADHFAAVATTNLNLPKGRWRFVTVSDDGVRLFVDGKPVLANWTWHGPTRDEAAVDVEAGEHEVRIEYFEIDGYAQLQFTIEPPA
ncbi:MAG: right-handed parallel beta-helix repeat-containing protein [Planctomycetota bacterium]